MRLIDRFNSLKCVQNVDLHNCNQKKRKKRKKKNLVHNFSEYVQHGVRTIVPEENRSLVRVRVRLRVKIKVGGQFSSEAIVLEPYNIYNEVF